MGRILTSLRTLRFLLASQVIFVFVFVLEHSKGVLRSAGACVEDKPSLTAAGSVRDHGTSWTGTPIVANASVSYSHVEWTRIAARVRWQPLLEQSRSEAERSSSRVPLALLSSNLARFSPLWATSLCTGYPRASSHPGPRRRPAP